MPEVKIPPGMVHTRSPAAAVNRWIDGDKVRFTPDPEKMKGNIVVYATAMEGVPRSAISYRAASGFEFRAFGTEKSLYSAASTDGSDVLDITPERKTSSGLVDPFTDSGLTTDTGFLVNVLDAAHDARQNDSITIAGSTPSGGLDMDGTYRIYSVVDVDNYLVEVSIDPPAGPFGGTLDITYKINVGPDSDGDGVGYGVGPYGREAYGTPRTASAITIEHRYWSLANYGTSLLAAYTNGTIYLFAEADDDFAQPLTDAPTDVRYVFVTPERYVIALRDGMEVTWPDVDDATDWVPSVTNTANTRTLAVGNKLMCGIGIGGGISLIWTDNSLYLMQFIGGDFIYDTRLIARDCGVIGQGAFVVANNVAFWMSPTGNFYMYTGQVTSVPNYEDVREWITDNITPEQGSKSFVFFDPDHREVWFIFPAEDSSEPSNYAMVNIDHWYWAFGTMERVAATLSGKLGLMMTSAAGFVYQHNFGVNDGDDSLPWRLLSGFWKLKEAARRTDIMGFAMDNQRQEGAIDVRFFAKDRTDTENVANVTRSVEVGDGQFNPRVSGRYFAIEYSQDLVDGDWKGGVPVMDIQDAGGRE